MENNTDHSEQNNFNPLTVQDVDVDFLPIVYEIIRRYYECNLYMTMFNILSMFYIIYLCCCSVERDYHDNAAKARESQECSQRVLELQKKFEIARAQVTTTFFVLIFKCVCVKIKNKSNVWESPLHNRTPS